MEHIEQFNTQDVKDCDTTYRVPSKRLADLKGRALAMYFAPELVKWKPQKVSGARALAMAYIDARAVMNRLDHAVGIDNWRAEYETLTDGSVRCNLSIRFENGGEWISKSDVGSESEQQDGGDRMKAAHSDALKRAAVHFGVGRYLYSLGSQWVDYDPQAKQFKATPQIPAGCIPSAYKPCGSDGFRKVCGLLETCLNKYQIPRDKFREATLKLMADYGYKTAEDGPYIENRHADAIRQRLNEWIAQMARDDFNCPQSIYYEPKRPADWHPFGWPKEQATEAPAPPPVAPPPPPQQSQKPAPEKDGKKAGAKR